MNISTLIFRPALLLTLLLFNFSTAINGQTEEELLQSTAAIQEFVSAYRGLEFISPVPKKVQTKAETTKFLKLRISEEFSAEEINKAERLLKRLDLVPEDYDYYSSMVELMTEQLAGMYDHKDKFLAIADWIPVELQQPTLAHEMTHALQDQYYGLENYLSPDLENDDEALALASLVEGDATLVMFAYTMAPLGQRVTDIPDYVELLQQQFSFMEAASPSLASSPGYIKQTLMFSYSFGAEFVKEFLLRNSWNEVESLYKNPPRTTEQIMHPEKFFGEPDLPQDASSIASLHFGTLEPWENEVCSNILGEFTTYLLLREHLGEETARKGAEGWDGDLVTLKEDLQKNFRETLQMTFCWDSEPEALEFRRAYEQYLLNKYSSQAVPGETREGKLLRVMTNNRITLSTQGSTVFITSRFPHYTLASQAPQKNFPLPK
jgi:hypothetical protein